ncbi:MAG: glycogen/starch synthase [Bacteroidia bacterium]|nr:glycogen/starch synthase [Bacteroidia bacterium]
MKKARILFVSQEITPYLESTPMGTLARQLPQGIQERGKEIRTFMPRYGLINERRNQLHEVIRLSGMNLIINDTDHPLIIKVASIQAARMQVYFIDNEDYFQRKAILHDKKGQLFEDNDERAIFFCRGVIETIKKLGWSPDIVHCHGWMTSLLPVYLKKSYAEDPMFENTKVVYSVYDEEFSGSLHKDFTKKVVHDGIGKGDLDVAKAPSFANVSKLAIQYSDAIIKASPKISADVEKYIKKSDKPVLDYQSPESYIDAYNDFYEQVLEEEFAMA